MHAPGKIGWNNLFSLPAFIEFCRQPLSPSTLCLLRRIQRTRNSCASSAEREMITGVVTVNLPSQVTQVVSRRSSRGRMSLGSEENAPAAAVNVVAEKKATQSKKRKSLEVLNAAEPAVERSRTVVEGEVSVLPQAIEVKEAEAPELKKPRTFAKRVLNPAKCSEIIDRLYTNYYESETLYTPRPYMEKQSDINAKMRAILVDWIVEVHYKFKLHQSTLWLCVNILDRYLEQVPTVRSDLQLVGVSSLFIACKFEEVYPPEVKECVYITDYAYTREQVLAMESRILRQLDYRICVSTGYHFLTRYLTFIDASEQVRYLSCYYAERNLQEYEMLNVPPNKFAAYAVYAALSFRLPEDCVSTSSVPIVCEESVWTPALARLTGYGKDDLVAGASDLLKHVREEVVTASKRQLIAAKKKYAAEKYNSISSLPVPHIVVSGAEKVEAEAKE